MILNVSDYESLRNDKDIAIFFKKSLSVFSIRSLIKEPYLQSLKVKTYYNCTQRKIS